MIYDDDIIDNHHEYRRIDINDLSITPLIDIYQWIIKENINLHL